MRHQPCFLLLLAAAWLGHEAPAATLIVTNAGDFGAGTLADAIAAANASPGPDVIRFNIQPPGAHIIYTADPIWTITDPLTIDGTTQPGYAGVPLIEFNSGAGWWSGLAVAASNCTIRGLSIVNGGADGIRLEANAHGTVIGGTNGAGNRIAFNGGNGVTVAGATNVSIRGNAIFANGGLGIDLGGDGVTANDNDDPDTGPNQLQNFPVISTATFSPSGLAVSGTLNSRPNTTCTLDFYANTGCDETGHGEGLQHLGSTTITTANSGDRSFSLSLTSAPAGRYITATATDPTGNTSEFSPCVRFSSTVAPATFTVTNVNDAGPGSLRQAILNSNARFASGPNTIAFNIPGAGVRRILLTSDVLPKVTEPAIIDGYTQPGSSVNTASNAFNGVVRIRLDGALLGYGRALDITAGSSTVRGLNIMNFAEAAVACSGAGSNTISGNLIGITVDGEVGPPVGFGGSSDDASIVLYYSANNLVGGANVAARNVVAGSGHGDLRLIGASSNRVFGCFFGCDATGTNGISAYGYGINVEGSTGNIIGGTNSLFRNVFLGHDGGDVYAAGSAGNVYQGNHFGVGIDGIQPLGQLGGLWLDGADNHIGGTNNGAGNLIAGTVHIYSGTGSDVLRNSFLGQDATAIDLANDGPTPNDPDDSDTGANNLQNYPEILSAIRYPNRTVIRSHLQSTPNATYRIDFYDNDRPPPSGYAEARTWIGTTNVTLAVSGQTNFNWSPAATLTPGHWVTATATDATNNTSELAPPVVVALSNEVNMVLTFNAPIDPVSRTSNFTYTVEVRNLGPTNATGVVLSNFLPANVSFVSASATQGACALAGGIVTCSLGGMTNGAMASVALTVHPLTNGPAELTARVAASQPESYPPDNVAVGGPFAGIADIDVVSGIFLPASVAAGQEFNTIITITNLGPDSAIVRIHVDWSWPDVGVSITTSQGTVMLSGVALIDADVGMLPAGGSSVITLRSLHAQAWSGGIGVTAGGDGFDPDGADYFYGSPSIVPGPGVITLENSVQEVGETAGSALLRVVRYGGAIGSVTVNYATSPGSATADADYTPVSGTLSFADGETEKSISVPVLDDFLTECLESLTVTLSSPTGGATFLHNGNTNCVVQILDNDPFLRGVVTGISVTATNVNASGDGFSETPSLSDDGRYIAFGSTSRNLVAGGPEVSYDVFVRDLMTGTTTLASVNRFGTNGADNGAYQPRLSATGRYLAFVSAGNNLVTNDNGSGYQQVYLRDMVSGTTRLLSSLSAGSSGATGNSDNALITSNGLGVAFNSSATDVSAVPDANAANDVYFRDVSSGVTHLVSVNRWGTAAGNGDSFLPYFANNASYRTHGRYVGFTSRASDLVAGDNNGFSDVFVRDLTNGGTTLVSMNRFGTGSGNGDSYDPLVNADGRYVLFQSYASDLVANDTNETSDVFVRDLVAGVTRLVSPNRFGTGIANGYSYHAGLSGDGRYALFVSEASDLAPGDNNGTSDVFVRDLVAGTTILVSANCDGTGTAAGWSGNSSISPDGRYVAFTSEAPDVVRGGAGSSHAYLRDLVTGTTTLLSPNWRGGVSPSGACYYPPVVANGAATVAFLSAADDLLPIDQNVSQDAFTWQPFAPGVADLSVDQFDGPDPAPAGANVTYVIGVRNHGPTSATNVVLTDTLPPGTMLVSATPSQGSCSNGGGVVTCELGGLNQDALALITLVLNPAHTGRLTNTASVAATGTDPAIGNNSSVEFTTVGFADLAIGYIAFPEAVALDAPVDIIVAVTNLGPDMATVVVLASGFPGSEIVRVSISQGVATTAGEVVTGEFGSLLPGAVVTLTVSAVPVLGNTVLFNGAEVSAQEADNFPANNAVSGGIPVYSNLGTLSMESFTLLVGESQANAILAVRRDGITEGTIRIGFATSNGTAHAGSDFTAITGTLTFGHNERSKTISIPLLNDAAPECLEQFSVWLFDPAGGALLGTPASSVVTIQDDDPAQLSISRSNTILRVRWSSVTSGYGLEATGSLNPPAQWQPVTEPVVDDGSFRTLVITNSVAPVRRFFRLRCP